MAAHAPWGAGNDLPQAKHGPTLTCSLILVVTWEFDMVCEFLNVLFFPGGGSDQPQSDLPLVALSQFDYYHWLRLLEFTLGCYFFPLIVFLHEKVKCTQTLLGPNTGCGLCGVRKGIWIFFSLVSF